MRVFSTAVLALALCGLALALAAVRPAHAEPEPVHALAMHGSPKYGADFTHFDYVNPDAPKGGDVRLHAIGAFDSFNPYILRGRPPAGIGLLFDSLLVSSADEPFTEYGLLAESIRMPEDRSWVIFTLRPEARFQDGTKVTPADVVFSFHTLRDKGAPFFRFYYGAVDSVRDLGEGRVKFTFGEAGNRELPLIVGQMPVLSEAYWKDRDFDRTTLEPPLGSGPYRIAGFETGRHVTYERDPEYWARDLPVRRGHYNFDRIRFDYYRDTTVALEAFQAGSYDFRHETEAKKWAVDYDSPAVTQGRILMEELAHQRPAGMQGFVFNTRRALFSDARVRRALAYLFDFEWSNRALFHGQYTRSNSFFANSELAAQGVPEGAELAVLEPFREHLPERLFTEPYMVPETDGSGNIREQMRRALALLREAGWDFEGGRLVHSETGRPFEFEILLPAGTASAWERIAMPFVRNLERVGVRATVRTIDTAQYKNRTDSFDFDMVVHVWGQSLSPGNEQRGYWTSTSADQPGSDNLAGVRDPVIDELVELVVAAPDRESLVTRTRALDRVLLWGHYVIPHWHIAVDRVAYWNRLKRPETVPQQGYQFMTWWVDPDS